MAKIPRYDKVDFLATAPHYEDHLIPVYRAVTKSFRGAFWTNDPGTMLSNIAVVSSEADRRLAKHRRVIRMEHGVGLSYKGLDHPSWPGGKYQNNVVAFLSPNRYAAGAWEREYPDIPVHIVGSPMMDFWHNNPVKPDNPRPLVIFSFHWDSDAVPETRWSFPEYRDEIQNLADDSSFDVAVHAHPTARATVRKWADKNGLRFLWNFTDVLKLADCYAVDNSSTLYEFASTDRPVVLLNSKHYRKKVNHGLRFWEYSDIGPNVWEPSQLRMAIEASLGGVGADQRHEATSILFPFRGEAANRAAYLIKEIAKT